jgi:hypothetical protein
MPPGAATDAGAWWAAEEEALRQCDLRVPANVGSDAASLVPARPWLPAWWFLAAAAAVLCAAEWCLYQRRWLS